MVSEKQNRNSGVQISNIKEYRMSKVSHKINPDSEEFIALKKKAANSKISIMMS